MDRLSAAAPELWMANAGRLPYSDGVALQERLRTRRAAGEVPDLLLLLEHDPVFTRGRRTRPEDLPLSVEWYRDRGVEVRDTDRGGDVTYHGPGQLVAYPIVRLTHAKAVRAHVEALEEACVRTAASFGVAARADRRRPGVWVGRDKLAAVGIRVDGRVTTHGLAFNVSTDLDDFAGLIPCGLADTGVCSLASLGVQTTVAEVRRRLVGHLGATLGRRVRWVPAADLGPAALAS